MSQWSVVRGQSLSKYNLFVPHQQLNEFQNFLDMLGYPYWNEINNPAYQLFLSSF